MEYKIIIACLAAMSFVVMSCKIRAGEGGSSPVNGKIWVEDWNAAFTVKNSEHEVSDEFARIM